MIHQDDLQYWLLQHKESKSHILSDLAIINKLKKAILLLEDFHSTGDMHNMTVMEIMQTALKISVDAYILAEKIKI